MKVVLPEKNKIKKRQLILYIVIMVVCIISVIIAFYVQFYARIDIGRLIGFDTQGEFGKKTEEQIALLQTEFDQIFTNRFENPEDAETKKIEEDKPIIYTKTEKKESKLNSYDLEVYIPYINIDNTIIETYNKEIEQFVNKTNSILQSQNKNTIYTVEYVANVQNEILSLMIRSNLKEGSSAQRVIIETYNYDLRNNKEITLEEVLRIQGLNNLDIQKKIQNEIETEQRKVEDLKNLGYNIYSRDITNDRYELKNTKQFYLTENTLYIIYAYGNETFTSEMDLIII